MKKVTVTALIVAGSMMIIGGGLMVTGFIMVGDSAGREYTKHEATYDCPSKKITIDTTVSEIYVERCGGDRVELSWYDSEKSKYEIKNDGEVLAISHKFKKKWWDYIGIRIDWPFGGHKNEYNLRIGIPDNYAGDMIIDTTVGNIKAEYADFAGRLEIDSTAGDIELKMVGASEVEINTTIGDVDAEYLSAKNSIEMRL